MAPQKKPAAQKSGHEKRKEKEAKAKAAARAAKRAKSSKKEDADEDEDEYSYDYAEEQGEEEELEDDAEVEPEGKGPKRNKTEKEKDKTNDKKGKSKAGTGSLGRIIEPDRDDFAEAYEAGLKQLKRGYGLNVQCLDAADVVIGEVLFEVLDLEAHAEGAIIEARYLARKGTTPSKSKLAKRGSGILVHLCMQPGCRKVPTDLKEAQWLHFGSWRAVASSKELPNWMSTKISAEWRKHAPKAQSKESKGGKEAKGQGPKKTTKEKQSKKKDSKSKGKPNKKSTAVMSRLREKIGELEEDKESEDEEDPSEDEKEDEEEAGKKGGTKVGKITVEELKDRLKTAREKLREKKEEQEKEKKKKRKPKSKRVSMLHSLRTAQEKKRGRSSEEEASDDDEGSDSDSESESRKRKQKKKKSQPSSQRKRKKKKEDKKNKKQKKESEDEEREEASCARSSSGSDSDSECEGLFRSAGRRENGLASKIARVAKKYPGRLMKRTIQSMYTTLHPGKAAAGCPPVLNQFLQQAMVAQGHLEGRNLRELQTIALAGDAILKGKLEEGLEILLQRWKRVEAVATGAMTPKAAEHLELLPPTRPSALSVDEREECAVLNRRWTNLGEKVQGRNGSPS